MKWYEYYDSICPLLAYQQLAQVNAHDLMWWGDPEKMKQLAIQLYGSYMFMSPFLVYLSRIFVVFEGKMPSSKMLPSKSCSCTTGSVDREQVAALSARKLANPIYSTNSQKEKSLTYCSSLR